MTEEESLDLEAIKAGDKRAFAALVDGYSPRLYRLALRMLGDPLEAEDVLQDTFIKAFRNLQSFEGRSKMGTWLYRIAANEALMRLRKREPMIISMDQDIETPEGSELPRQLEDWCCLPEGEFMTAEGQEQLDRAIETLSPALRAAFVLRDLQGLSTKEASEALGISESALKTRLSRARLELREQLTAYFSERVREHQDG